MSKISLFALRIGLGWVFLYAGMTKVLNPEWSAAGYLKGAKTFSSLYGWFASSANIGWVNFLNEWGLTLVGLALILGISVRIASYAGVLLMLLYYFPVLTFPYIGKNSYLVDDHIVYAFALLVLSYFNAGRAWGFQALVEGKFKGFLKKYPILAALIT